MITASIVLYNTQKQYIQKVIDSFKPNNDRRLFIIDNSEYKSDAYYSVDFVDYIFNGNNIGYGAAHNIGIKKAIDMESEYHIVLNPDIEFNSEIIDTLIMYANKNEDVVYILPKVVYPSGDTQYLCKLLPTPFDLIVRRFLPKRGILKKWNERYELKQSGYDKIINPPCLSGCFMFMRVSTLCKHNFLFDERFFMYCEDFDLIRRLHSVGKTIYYPYVSIIHNHEKASYKSVVALFQHIRSACKYFNKYGWFFDRKRKYENRLILEEIKKIDCKNKKEYVK